MSADSSVRLTIVRGFWSTSLGATHKVISLRLNALDQDDGSDDSDLPDRDVLLHDGAEFLEAFLLAIASRRFFAYYVDQPPNDQHRWDPNAEDLVPFQLQPGRVASDLQSIKRSSPFEMWFVPARSPEQALVPIRQYRESLVSDAYDAALEFGSLAMTLAEETLVVSSCSADEPVVLQAIQQTLSECRRTAVWL